jgi:hypothetical protein
MRPRHWLLTTISLVLILVAVIAALNAMLDVYGLWRPTQGRRLSVFGDARVAKYLLSMRYVPENFNAVLAGASVAANWDVTGVENLRVYNESLNGGNIVEERALIETAIQRPGIAVVFLLVHPALTHAHEFRTVELKPELKRSALGSVSLWDAYREMLKVRFARLPQAFNYAGTDETFTDRRGEMNLNMKKMWNAPDFAVDPIALRAYLDLVANLRAHQIRIVFIVPPTSEQLLHTKRDPLERYVRRMRREIGPGDLWIDFLSEDPDGFFANEASFSDGVHLVREGAKQVVAHINTAVNRWMAQGQLGVAP